jgi:hypothetical protein
MKKTLKESKGKNQFISGRHKESIFSNKKGFSMISDSDVTLFWFIILFVITIAVIFVVSWSSSLKHLYLNDALQPTAYEARLIYSDKCFAYREQSGRVLTGTIDINKFNSGVLFDCLPLSAADEHALAVTLNAQDISSTLKTSNWNINTEQIVQNNYIVHVKRGSEIIPGLLTFSHKSGE